MSAWRPFQRRESRGYSATSTVARVLAAAGIAGACLTISHLRLSAQENRGQVQTIVVHGASLERNRIGASADRAVSVYLPPSYARGARRYPVIYLLHGIMDSPSTWTTPWSSGPANPGFATIQDLMDRGIAAGTLQEMIVVMPDADKTCHYTDSPVKGGWSTFIARDLVADIDRRYRTVAGAPGRGLMGHSMGGHGAIKIAMRFPSVFTAVYAMNPSMLGWGGDVSPDNPSIAAVGRITSLDDLSRQDFYTQAVVGIGQCFAPDTTAPLLTQPILQSSNGVTRPGPARDLWTSQMPVHMASRHVDALSALRGLRFDSAFEDEFTHIPISSRRLSQVLDSLGVEHTFEMYNGDHRNRLWGREGRLYTGALPFFSRLLSTSSSPATATSVPSPANTAAVHEKFWDAVRKGDTRRANEALAAGADVNAIDTVSGESGGSRSGRRALNYAALHNQARMVQWLVERGGNVNLANRTGFTPLHHAAEKGSFHAAEALLKAGADPNAKLPSGSTPLAVATQRRFTQVVRLLEPVTRR